MNEFKDLVMQLIAAQARGDREQWNLVAVKIANLEENQCACCHKILECVGKDQVSTPVIK